MMMPGVDPRMMKQAMKRMGMKQTEIDASQVIIKTREKDLVIDNPEVMLVSVMGQESFQVTGQVREVSHDAMPDVSDDDLDAVISQTGCSRDTARRAIQDAKGDLAAAILALKGE